MRWRDLFLAEMRSLARLWWAVQITALLVAGLWLLISVVRYHTEPEMAAVRAEACCDTPEPQGHLLLGRADGARRSEVAVVLAADHPLLAALIDDLYNPSLAHLLLLLCAPLILVVLWHWDDLLMRPPA